MTFNAFQFNKTSFNKSASTGSIDVGATLEVSTNSKIKCVIELDLALSTTCQYIPPSYSESKIKLEFEIFTKITQPVEVDIGLSNLSSTLESQNVAFNLAVSSLSNASLCSIILPELDLQSEIYDSVLGQVSSEFELDAIVLSKLLAQVQANIIVDSICELATAGVSALNVGVEAEPMLIPSVETNLILSSLITHILSKYLIDANVSLFAEATLSTFNLHIAELHLSAEVLPKLFASYAAIIEGNTSPNNTLIDNPYYPGDPTDPDYPTYPNYPRPPDAPDPVLTPDIPTTPQVPKLPITVIINGAIKPRVGFVIDAYMR